MILELLIFISAIILALFFFAESGKPLLGFVGSVLLLILSFWIFSDGIQMQTQKLETITQTGTNLEAGTETIDGNATTIAKTITLNSTESSITSYAYADLPATPYIAIPQLLGTLFFLVALFSMFYYAPIFTQ